MSAEAEAADILVRVSMEGAEQFIKITGTAAKEGFALLAAMLRTVYEKTRGKQKLGGKFNARTFLENFNSSTVFSLTKNDMKLLEPELKRLHIPYMQYKRTKDMKSDGKVEISVRREDAEKFIRLAESKGIAAVEAYDFKGEEISEKEYDELLNGGGAKGVDFFVAPDGTITINEHENPTQAPAAESPSAPSEPNSKEYSTDSFTFDPDKGVGKNLAEAKVEAARRDGRLVPISANKETLLEQTSADGVLLKVPGTKGQEHLFVPKADIVSMFADGGKTVRVDLRRDYHYQIYDGSKEPLRQMSGEEIKQSGKWDKVRAPKLPTAPKTPKIPTKGART